jgi:hypothetical protein
MRAKSLSSLPVLVMLLGLSSSCWALLPEAETLEESVVPFSGSLGVSSGNSLYELGDITRDFYLYFDNYYDYSQTGQIGLYEEDGFYSVFYEEPDCSQVPVDGEWDAEGQVDPDGGLPDGEGQVSATSGVETTGQGGQINPTKPMCGPGQVPPRR